MSVLSAYAAAVQSSNEETAVPIAPWRFMLMTLMVVGLYLAVRLVVTPPQTHPALLLASIPSGALCGLLAAKWEATKGQRPQRGRRGMPVSAARWYLFGLAGAGLALAQALPPAGLEWLALGLTALGAGGAGHAWLKQANQGT